MSSGVLSSSPGGIYIHVPFCRSKCSYCNFYSITEVHEISHYVDMLVTELVLSGPLPCQVDTIYLGGGTPSLLAPDQISRILETLCRHFSISSRPEITLEVNPGTTDGPGIVDQRRLSAYRQAGINRLTIGVQSTDDAVLRFLGRSHTAAQAISVFRDAQAAGFENIGTDLIYGIPGQTLSLWQAELTRMAALSPTHLSCYTLTLEPGTLFSENVKKGSVPSPDDRQVAALFSFTPRWLEKNRYRQYEVSNFFRHHPEDGDYRSRHNCKYWNFSPYRGFGPAAHSFEKNRRWWNHRDFSKWSASLSAGTLPVAGSEILTREQRLIESVYLGLRQTAGIDVDRLEKEFGIEFFSFFGDAVKNLVSAGMMTRSPECVRLTQKGMRFLESAASMMISQIPDLSSGHPGKKR